MKGFLLFVFFWLLGFEASFGVLVESLDEQVHNPSMLGLRLRVQNEADSVLSNVKIRYVFSTEATKRMVVDVVYAPGADVSLHQISDELGFVEITCDSLPQGFFPNFSGFSLGLHYADWSEMNKSKHLSYQESSAFVENHHVSVYKNDSLVYGDAIDLSESKPKFRIVGFQAEDNAWIDIQNNGVAAFMDGISLIGSNGEAFLLDSISLDSLEVLRICQNKVSCEGFPRSLVLSKFAWGRIGEAILKSDSLWLSYVPWGGVGHFAEEAVMSGVWADTEDYFESMMEVFSFPIKYRKNAFFRMILGTEGKTTKDWFAFTDRDSLRNTEAVPTPVKIVGLDSIRFKGKESDSVYFGWLSVPNANSYRVSLQKGDSLIAEVETANTFVKLKISESLFKWNVVAGYKQKSGELLYGKSIEEDYIAVQNKSIDDESVLKSKILPVPLLKARKDTRMLSLGYAQDALAYGWDVSHLDSANYDYLEANRCWAVSIQMLNHYYGGNITQDEVVFFTKFNPAEPLLSALPPSGASDEEIWNALKLVLKTDELNVRMGSPSVEEIKKALDAGKPIYSSTYVSSENGTGHAMVIAGYLEMAGDFFVLYKNLSNNGVEGWSSVENGFQYSWYCIPEVEPGNVMMTDYRVSYDSDGDGVVNFDEEERFGTNPFDSDSDGDGMDDKCEIYRYMIQSRYSKQDDLARRQETILSQIIDNSDKDKDGFRAELDDDDNGDGLIDGLEGTDSILEMDVPLDYTLFARDHLSIHDGVECFGSELENDSFCRVGAAGKNGFTYGASPEVLSLGVRSHVGTVDVNPIGYDEGIIVLRSGATVHGNLNLFANTVGLYISGFRDDEDFLEKFVKRQNSSSILGNFNALNSLRISGNESSRLGDYQCNLPDLRTVQYKGDKIVKSGEQFVLKDDDAYRSIVVQSGGTLVLGEGTMYVDSLLQVESGSSVEYLNPGHGTVLHLNGKLIWRSSGEEPLSDKSFWMNVARGFKLVQHSSKTMFIEGEFGGTIYAPLSKLVLGQVSKTLYGRFLAKDISVHQYAKIFHIEFNPIEKPVYVFREVEK